ncbi:MAG: CBS domain-containing protein [Gammaproteobacteria bacterium]|nr:CBS domain-containing protein [Gammaproteobacteria bacterium]
MSGPGLIGWLAQLLSGDPKEPEQLIQLLRDAQERDVVDSDTLAMLEGVFQVKEMRVRDIMIPRSQMSVVARDAPPETVLSSVVESAHSRFPVVDDQEEVVGILLAKDLLASLVNDDRSRLNLRTLLRPAVFIPESKRLSVLLKEFRASRNHMAIVVDEYGEVAGLVTIEDVLEQIVGEIEDEHDPGMEEEFILDRGDGTFTAKGLAELGECNARFNIELDESEFDTIGGALAAAFGHLPKRGEQITLQGCGFTVLRADKRRIHLVHASPGTGAEIAD